MTIGDTTPNIVLPTLMSSLSSSTAPRTSPHQVCTICGAVIPMNEHEFRSSERSVGVHHRRNNNNNNINNNNDDYEHDSGARSVTAAPTTNANNNNNNQIASLEELEYCILTFPRILKYLGILFPMMTDALSIMNDGEEDEEQEEEQNQRFPYQNFLVDPSNNPRVVCSSCLLQNMPKCHFCDKSITSSWDCHFTKARFTSATNFEDTIIEEENWCHLSCLAKAAPHQSCCCNCGDEFLTTEACYDLPEVVAERFPALVQRYLQDEDRIDEEYQSRMRRQLSMKFENLDSSYSNNSNTTTDGDRDRDGGEPAVYRCCEKCYVGKYCVVGRMMTKEQSNDEFDVIVKNTEKRLLAEMNELSYLMLSSWCYILHAAVKPEKEKLTTMHRDQMREHFASLFDELRREEDEGRRVEVIDQEHTEIDNIMNSEASERKRIETLMKVNSLIESLHHEEIQSRNEVISQEEQTLKDVSTEEARQRMLLSHSEQRSNHQQEEELARKLIADLEECSRNILYQFMLSALLEMTLRTSILFQEQHEFLQDIHEAFFRGRLQFEESSSAAREIVEAEFAERILLEQKLLIEVEHAERQDLEIDEEKIRSSEEDFIKEAQRIAIIRVEIQKKIEALFEAEIETRNEILHQEDEIFSFDLVFSEQREFHTQQETYLRRVALIEEEERERVSLRDDIAQKLIQALEQESLRARARDEFNNYRAVHMEQSRQKRSAERSYEEATGRIAEWHRERIHKIEDEQSAIEKQVRDVIREEEASLRLEIMLVANEDKMAKRRIIRERLALEREEERKLNREKERRKLLQLNLEERQRMESDRLLAKAMKQEREFKELEERLNGHVGTTLIVRLEVEERRRRADVEIEEQKTHQELFSSIILSPLHQNNKNNNEMIIKHHESRNQDLVREILQESASVVQNNSIDERNKNQHGASGSSASTTSGSRLFPSSNELVLRRRQRAEAAAMYLNLARRAPFFLQIVNEEDVATNTNNNMKDDAENDDTNNNNNLLINNTNTLKIPIESDIPSADVTLDQIVSKISRCGERFEHKYGELLVSTTKNISDSNNNNKSNIDNKLQHHQKSPSRLLALQRRAALDSSNNNNNNNNNCHDDDVHDDKLVQQTCSSMSKYYLEFEGKEIQPEVSLCQLGIRSGSLLVRRKRTTTSTTVVKNNTKNGEGSMMVLFSPSKTKMIQNIRENRRQ